MKKMYLMGLALLTTMLMIMSTSAHAANLIATNPGFDADTAMPPTGWSMTGDGYAGAIDPKPWAKSSPNVLKFWSTGGSTYTYQDFTVVGDVPYLVKAWAYNDSTDNGGAQNFEAFVKIEFPGHATVGESSHFNGSTMDTWVPLTAQATAPTGATTGRLTIAFRDISDPNKGSIAFDDAYADVVPEPASLLLLGSGLVGLLALRKRTIK